jgi:hypothetical protein
MILDRIEVLQQDKNIAELNLKIRKSYKERLVFGNIDLKVPAGNNFVMEVKTLKKQGKMV